jgi:hypothetical protein
MSKSDAQNMVVKWSVASRTDPRASDSTQSRVGDVTSSGWQNVIKV